MPSIHWPTFHVCLCMLSLSIWQVVLNFAPHFVCVFMYVCLEFTEHLISCFAPWLAFRASPNLSQSLETYQRSSLLDRNNDSIRCLLADFLLECRKNNNIISFSTWHMIRIIHIFVIYIFCL